MQRKVGAGVRADRKNAKKKCRGGVRSGWEGGLSGLWGMVFRVYVNEEFKLGGSCRG